jgi:hypothetical protein
LPPLENTLSEELELAGIAKIDLATSLNKGN